MWWGFYLPLFPLVVLAVQDFRSRSISTIGLLCFSMLILAASLWRLGLSSSAIHLGLNLLLLLYLCGGVWLWLRIRYGENTRPLQAYIGWGDIWLLLALTPCFKPRTFLIFLLVSLIAGLLFYGIGRILMPRQQLTIPLVGVLGITFTLYVILNPFLA